jgi:AcrR family transcriptional regulator
LAEGSIVQEERRRQILHAAVRAFARKGYHASRVSDIATEAGVAYGLVYHYFASKEGLLGQREGTFCADVDARVTATIWYRALEEILTGWAFGQLPDSDDDVAAAETAVVEIVVGGLAIGRAAALA